MSTFCLAWKLKTAPPDARARAQDRHFFEGESWEWLWEVTLFLIDHLDTIPRYRYDFGVAIQRDDERWELIAQSTWNPETRELYWDTPEHLKHQQDQERAAQGALERFRQSKEVVEQKRLF